MSSSYVVKLVTDDELLVKASGLGVVKVGDLLEVLDPTTMKVKDPITGDSLGSVKRVKANLVVTSVAPGLILCAAWGRSSGGLSAISRVMAGEPQVNIRGSEPHWPERVDLGDPVEATGRRVKREEQ